MKLLARFLPDPDPLDFAPPLLRLQDRAPNPLGRKVLWVLLFFLFGLLLWVLFGKLDIVAVARGKLIPKSYVKIVQPSEAGIVKEILVREGETVRAGQVLMRMDGLMTEADAKSLKSDYDRKSLTLRRIDAELSGTPFRGSPGEPPELIREIKGQYRANCTAEQAALAEERSQLIKAKQDLSAAAQVRTKLAKTLSYYRRQEYVYTELAKDGSVASLTAGDKRRERIEKEQELKTQEHVTESARASVFQHQKTLAQIASDYRRKLYTERNEVANALDKLTQEIAKQKHRQDLLELKAPQNGIVKDLATHTAGTVVQPGTVLLTLVPEDGALRAEVWISNQDIGFVHRGQPVKLKFAAFPYQEYGMTQGIVEYVSVDAADNAANDSGPSGVLKSGRSSPLLYKALVTMNSATLKANGRSFRLTTGMQTNAEILLGTRTVAEYLLSPVRKAWQESGRER